PDFHTIVATGVVTTDSSRDYTIHVDPFSLQPATVYFYRFIVTNGSYSGQVSPTGRTKTAPAPGIPADQLTLALALCANCGCGYFIAYLDMANRAKLFDATVFLGVYIYEYGSREYAGNGPVRLHAPAHELRTLNDYRRRYARYRTDDRLQAAHVALLWIAVWDDHETANNSWAHGAENHDPTTQGEWITRRAAAMQAYFEWQTVRAPGH